MSVNRSIYIETLGCEKNRVDTEIMMGRLIEDGASITESMETAEVIIINTCGFIQPAVNESIDRILALAANKDEGACKKLIVVGCLVERYKDRMLQELPEIDAILGTRDYTRLSEIIENLFKSQQRINALEGKPGYSIDNFDQSRAFSQNKPYTFLKIAEGCSNQCAFCLIPKIRGRYVSKPVESIAREVKAIREWGIKEINLISQDCSSYGIDNPEQGDLTTLVNAILDQNEGEFWLRLFYLYPNRFPLPVIELMNQDHRLAPYVDMPIQHISDRVLKDMRRQITGNEIRRLLDNILKIRSDVAIRTTLMVGFPGETEAEFRELERLVEQGYFTHVGVFEYSPEEKTAAYRFEDSVTQEEKVERKERVMAAQQSVSFEKNKAMVGQKQKVLLEGEYEETELLLKGRNIYQGAEVDGLVLINEGTADAGEFCQVEITEAHPYDLIGKII